MPTAAPPLKILANARFAVGAMGTTDGHGWGDVSRIVEMAQSATSWRLLPVPTSWGEFIAFLDEEDELAALAFPGRTIASRQQAVRSAFALALRLRRRSLGRHAIVAFEEGPVSGGEAVRRQLDGYVKGRLRFLDVPMAFGQCTPFERAVWSAAAKIPFGETRTYGELSAEIGKPRATRAVGAALGRNPLPLFIPCHRVVASDGGLGGFSAGLDWKRKLLRHEARAA